MTSDAGDFYWGMLGPEEFEGPMSALAMAHGWVPLSEAS